MLDPGIWNDNEKNLQELNATSSLKHALKKKKKVHTVLCLFQHMIIKVHYFIVAIFDFQYFGCIVYLHRDYTFLMFYIFDSYINRRTLIELNPNRSCKVLSDLTVLIILLDAR